ncbi:MAG TPA: hypothetical protein VMU53_03525 [Candidatus Sulfotelmatobacter sp.]|nr:hypothetical protein [Candidatus Sulfotelmatobacter sp.]
MDQQTRHTKPSFKNPFIYSWLVLVVVAAYVVFLLLSRYDSNRAYERRTQQKAAEQQRESDRAAIEQLGGSDLAIRAFYIAPAEIRRGGTAQICYDVANAKTVTLAPPVGEVWPSHNRCLDVSPTKTTSYTLTISNSNGNTTSQTVELKVR